LPKIKLEGGTCSGEEYELTYQLEIKSSDGNKEDVNASLIMVNNIPISVSFGVFNTKVIDKTYELVITVSC
jgi:hypothetical protein